MLTKVAQRPSISRLALANIGRDASAVAAILGTDWYATIAARGFRVAFATFIHGLLLRQFLRECKRYDQINERALPSHCWSFSSYSSSFSN